MIREGTEGMICDEQGVFRRGRGCINQIFAVRQVCKAFLDLEKKMMIELIGRGYGLC